MDSATENGAGAPDLEATTKNRLHGRAFYESIGSPKYILAPMVDQSEFAWRMLCRSYLKPEEQSNLLCYTPMLHARLYSEVPKYRASHFEPTKPRSPNGTNNPPKTAQEQEEQIPHLDGNPDIDRPLIVQFCANTPSHLHHAAHLVSPHCDAIDLNLGCPQGIARRGNYGAFLQENQPLIQSLINVVHSSPPSHISVPVTAKIRLLDTHEETLAYARNVLAAGASILAVHGRRREQKGHLTGLADWKAIRRLREALPKETVVFANGNILQHGDLARCLEVTGADGVMSAEGALSNPGIFSPAPTYPGDEEHGRVVGEYWWENGGKKGGWRVDAVVRRYADLLWKYGVGTEAPERNKLYHGIWDPEGYEGLGMEVGDGSTCPGIEGLEDEVQEEEDGAVEGGEGPARKKRKVSPKKKSKKKKGSGKEHQQVTSPNLTSMQAHLFHLLRHFVTRHTDVRDMLAGLRGGDMESLEKVVREVERKCAWGIDEYERTFGESWEKEEKDLDRRIVGKLRGDGKKDVTAASGGENGEVAKKNVVDEDEYDEESSLAIVRECRRPWWVCQPIIRPLPKEALARGSVQVSKKDRKRIAEEKEKAKAEEGQVDGSAGDAVVVEAEGEGEKEKKGDVVVAVAA